MKIELDKLGKAKQGFHAVQSLLIFVAACLALAVLTKTGYTGGQTGFFFALVSRLLPCEEAWIQQADEDNQCFLSVPALIYQVMVPIWPRARRFANAYAYATIDILFAILWFSASVAVSVWNAAGTREGESADKNSDGSCSYFAYGDPTKCSVSKASVGLGIIVFLLFSITSAISVLMVIRYRRDGIMPGRREKPAGIGASDDAGKGVWSTNIEEHDHEDMQEVPDDERLRYEQQTPEDDEQRLLHPATSYDSNNYYVPHPGRPLSHSSSAHSIQSGRHYDEYVPSALSPVRLEDEATPVYQFPPVPPQLASNRNHSASFPAGNYERV